MMRMAGACRTLATVGDRIPNVGLRVGFPHPKTVDLPARLAGRRVVVLGLPGAFTPT